MTADVGKDGLLVPTSDLRRKIAECAATGMHYKDIAAKLSCNSDYVRKSLKQDDVKAHILRLHVDQGEVKKLRVKDWRDLAPHVTEFYEYVMLKSMAQPDYIKVQIGKDADDEPMYEEKPNPVSQHYQKLAAQVAARIEDRAWGKTPQKIEVDRLPTAERLESLSDAQLDYYRRQIVSGIDKNIAFAEAMRIEEAEYEFADDIFSGFVQDAEVLAIEGEVEED